MKNLMGLMTVGLVFSASSAFAQSTPVTARVTEGRIVGSQLYVALVLENRGTADLECNFDVRTEFGVIEVREETVHVGRSNLGRHIRVREADYTNSFSVANLDCKELRPEESMASLHDFLNSPASGEAPAICMAADVPDSAYLGDLGAYRRPCASMSYDRALRFIDERFAPASEADIRAMAGSAN